MRDATLIVRIKVAAGAPHRVDADDGVCLSMARLCLTPPELFVRSSETYRGLEQAQIISGTAAGSEGCGLFGLWWSCPSLTGEAKGRTESPAASECLAGQPLQHAAGLVLLSLVHTTTPFVPHASNTHIHQLQPQFCQLTAAYRTLFF